MSMSMSLPPQIVLICFPFRVSSLISPIAMITFYPCFRPVPSSLHSICIYTPVFVFARSSFIFMAFLISRHACSTAFPFLCLPFAGDDHRLQIRRHPWCNVGYHVSLCSQSFDHSIISLKTFLFYIQALRPPLVIFNITYIRWGLLSFLLPYSSDFLPRISPSNFCSLAFCRPL
jgi:hypothetical protein